MGDFPAWLSDLPALGEFLFRDARWLLIGLIMLAVLILFVQGLQLRDTRQLSAKIIARISALDDRVDAFLDALERRAELVDRRAGGSDEVARTQELTPGVSHESQGTTERR
jgi:hypothetical protein